MNTCVNCTNSYEGHYCNQCGEKLISEKDFTFKHFLDQALNAFTNLDNKFLRTIKLLCFRPGLLSKYFVEGRRVNFMKPFQIFLIANLFFFILLSDVDIFRSPSKWYFVEDFDGVAVMSHVKLIMEEKGLTQIEVANMYDNKSNNLAKLLLILFIPYLGFLGMLLHYRQKKKVGMHLVYAQHFFTFFLLYCLIGIPMLNFLPLFIDMVLIAMLVLYQIIGIKTFYNQIWLYAIWKGVLMIAFLVFGIDTYRRIISYITLYLL